MKIMTTLCAAALAICGTLSIQAASSVDRVNVHFDTPIQVGGTTIPAGDCSIQVLRGSSNVRLAIHPDSGSPVMVVVNPVNDMDNDPNFNDTHTRVILNHRGNEYRFEKILFPDHSGFELLPSVE